MAAARDLEQFWYDEHRWDHAQHLRNPILSQKVILFSLIFRHKKAIQYA
jgi:hypothetical protein